MTKHMQMRPYRPADWLRLCEIHDLSRPDELRPNRLQAAFLPLAQTAQNEGLFDGQVWVAELQGRVEGFVAFAGHELTWLYVHPDAYRRGIGRALLHHALAACGGAMQTEVLVDNTWALGLYLAEGFCILQRTDGKLAGNESFAASGYVLQRVAGATGAATPPA
jgi:ribosomal protein S18 acetylase RimI-like enzyme